jgi:uncharacterized membrane protein
MRRRSAAARETYGVERLNALSDGVFAIILTLLVLDLDVPDPAVGESVPEEIVQNWHLFVAWGISFVAIARFWMVHHAVMARLERCHAVTLALNFAVLGVASLVPFTADVLGNAEIAEPWSTAVFAANFALLSLGVGLLARHAAAEPALARASAAPESLDRYRRHHLLVLPLVCLAAAVLAFAHPYVAVALLVTEFLVAAWRLAGPGRDGSGAAAPAYAPGRGAVPDGVAVLPP